MGTRSQRAKFVGFLCLVVASGCSLFPSGTGIPTEGPECASGAPQESVSANSDVERPPAAAQTNSKSPVRLDKKSGSKLMRVSDLERNPTQLVRVTMQPQVSDHFWTQSSGQNAYVGRIVKVTDAKYLLKATLMEGRSSTHVKLIDGIPILRRNFGANTGVGQETVDNKEIWIDRADVESIEIAD